jgi:hypothetical protein
MRTVSLGSTFGMPCVKCKNQLIAPERSEYCSDGYARYVWRCCRCCFCFESLVFFRANTMSRKGTTREHGLAAERFAVGV